MILGLSNKYALSRLEMDFHKNQIGDDVIMTSFFLLVNTIRAERMHRFGRAKRLLTTLAQPLLKLVTLS